MSVSIVEFGRQVARALGSGTNAARLARQEAAVVEYAIKRSRNGLTAPLRRWAVAGTLTAAAISLTLYLGLGKLGGALGVHPHPGSETNNADRSDHQWINLADGSRLGVASDAEVQVLEQTNARVRLVSGKVKVQVAKQHGEDWVLVAGPYRVAVIGTQFDVAFDARSEGFEVRVTEGLVRVFGGDLPNDGLSLQGGQRYANSRTVEPSPTAPSPVELAPPEVADAVTQEPNPVMRQSPVSAPSPGARALESGPHRDDGAGLEAASPTWRQSCAAGRYGEAFPPGSIENFQGLLDQSLEGELLQLANCLRYAGRSSEAERTLSNLRARFPGSPGASLASYHLARLSQRNAKAELAIRWFATYLKESPSGQLAASARAELVRLWVQQGNTAKAHAAARDYLRHHPRGSFAGQAEELLDRPATSP